MSRLRGVLLALAGGSMELCWMHGWAMFCCVAIVHRPFPFLEGVCTFLLALCVTRLSAGRGWRVAETLALHTFVFAVAALRIIYVIYFDAYPFLSSAWLSELFTGPRGFLQWVGYVLVWFWSLAFWIGGVTFSIRPRTYFAFCSRLDIGLGAFFCLFALKLVILAKGGERIEDPASGIMIYPFFLFSFFAIGLARLRNDGLRTFLPRHRGAGIITGFAVTVVALGGGLILFSMSGLSATAQAASRVLKLAAGVSSPYVERLLRLFFFRGTIRSEPVSSSPKGNVSDMITWAKGIWWVEFLEKALGWVFVCVFIALILAIVGVIIFFVAKWLLSRGKTDGGRGSNPEGFAVWLRELWAIALRFTERMSHFVRGYHRASELYSALRLWGRRAGLPPAGHDTPLEFGARLQNRFPHLTPEIDLIVGAYNQEIYGEMESAGQSFKPILRAWKRLQSPLLWPMRIKVRLLGSRAGYKS
jgi:hypothetical protein